MEKIDKKNARRLAKEMRREFLEENECVELEPDSERTCCGTTIQEFDAHTHDAWLLQCPKGLDPEQLVGKKIKLPGRRYVGDLQVRASNYSEPLNEAVGYVSSKGKYALRSIPLSGYVVVSKRLNAQEPSEDDSGATFPLPLPPLKYKLPVRHPFFGTDYKKRIEVPEVITQNLGKADKKSLETSSRLRRTANFYTIRRKMLTNSQTLQEKELDVRQSVLTGLTPSFMKTPANPASYMDAVDEVAIKVEPVDSEETPAKKRKKAKSNGHVEEIKIKEEPVSPKKKQKRKANGEVVTNGSATVLEEISIKEEPVDSPPKKRKKRKEQEAN
ncbi:uncharacterized protein Dana_GF20924 [Drosophila ananassae]|uniref:Uncharacterized protein n=1 Tax=Drosophila ananassae TaxID=7217 RepID=B3MRV6_DROAN|nr:uncharacterized protein LOC6503615 [Drosophila ananassae]EDV34511.1 uncharacterized protein Dana_GF20924 [Drosophila ananassae]